MMNIGVYFFAIVIAAATFSSAEAKLRGVNSSNRNANFDDLKRRIENPHVRDEIRGKTVRELAFENGDEFQPEID